jgi:hypothetical protein
MLTQPHLQQMAQLQRQRQHQHQQQRKQQAGKQPIQDRQLPQVAGMGPRMALRSQQRRRHGAALAPRPPLQQSSQPGGR